MSSLFGTDGVRGVANRELTPELAYALGRYGAYVLLEGCKARRPRVLVGRDTRISETCWKQPNGRPDLHGADVLWWEYCLLRE